VIAITTKIDFSDVDRGFRALVREGHSRGALRALVRPMRADQKAHHKEQRGPESAWAPRARATVLKARKGKGLRRGRPKKLLGSLPNRTLVVTVKNGDVVAYSKVPWSGIHQEGGTAGRGAKIPARPFLWLSEDFFAEAVEILAARLLAAWSKG